MVFYGNGFYMTWWKSCSEIGDVSPPCLGDHVKPSALHLTYESDGIENAPKLCAHAWALNNLLRKW